MLLKEKTTQSIQTPPAPAGAPTTAAATETFVL
jgi:hypothetical protein